MITIPAAIDVHIHLRQAPVLADLVPCVASGGVGCGVVMPNTTPPITTTDRAIAYHTEIMNAVMQSSEHLTASFTPSFFINLYLTPELSPEEIRKAKRSGLVLGVKAYPHGVTTNSHLASALSLTSPHYEPLFQTMQDEGLILCLHGEVPSCAEKNICILNAELSFLPTLMELHRRYPKLRIVLEHATTVAAIDAVKACGDTVACSITVHHLDLIVDDWAGRSHNYCKPVAKYPCDRDALRAVIVEGHPRFFLGSDSAPHPRSAKEGAVCAAGVFTSPHLLPLIADVFERIGALHRLQDFTSGHAARWYGLPLPSATVTLRRVTPTCPHIHTLSTCDCVGVEGVVPALMAGVVPFRTGQRLGWVIHPLS